MKKLVILTLALFLGFAGAAWAIDPPALKDAESTHFQVCPSGVVIVVAGFYSKEDLYTLMYFGQFKEQGEDLVSVVPYVWVRFEGTTPVEVLLVGLDGKAKSLGMAELSLLYPTPCDLAGTIV